MPIVGMVNYQSINQSIKTVYVTYVQNSVYTLLFYGSENRCHV